MNGADIRLDHVDVRFGAFHAVKNVTLDIEAGTFFSILGPSGCGKTTLLRLISGFVEASSGRVSIGGRDMAGLTPNQRPTALIFQNLALFPLMSVRENVAFGLEARGVPRRERLARAEELLDLVALPGQGGKRPTELSGGQRQRVAIARALAVEPSVLLLDEPLSALDLKLRQHMRTELRAIQRKTGVTFVYITHDQGEALTMSDRIAVMNKGEIEQVGAPEELYEAPRTAFTARFIGEQNAIPGAVTEVADGRASISTSLGPLAGKMAGALEPGEAATLLVRPERLHLANGSGGIAATVTGRDLEGPFFALHADAAGLPLTLHVVNVGAVPRQGDRITLAFNEADALVFPTKAAPNA